MESSIRSGGVFGIMGFCDRGWENNNLIIYVFFFDE